MPLPEYPAFWESLGTCARPKCADLLGKLLCSLDAPVVPTHCKVLRIRCTSL